MTLDECIVRCDNNSGDNPRGRDVAQIGGWLRELRERRNAPGNAAALREALENAHNNIKKAREFIAWQTREDELLMEAQQEIKTALAAPARNCDRFATELDARLAWKRETHCKGDYRYWLFDPAEGGTE